MARPGFNEIAPKSDNTATLSYAADQANTYTKKAITEAIDELSYSDTDYGWRKAYDGVTWGLQFGLNAMPELPFLMAEAVLSVRMKTSTPTSGKTTNMKVGLVYYDGSNWTCSFFAELENVTSYTTVTVELLTCQFLKLLRLDWDPIQWRPVGFVWYLTSDETEGASKKGYCSFARMKFPARYRNCPQHALMPF